MNILLLTSSFPNKKNEISGLFVKDQVDIINKLSPETKITVLTPGPSFENTNLKIVNFKYFPFKKFEQIGVKSILDLTKNNKLYYIVILFYTFAMFKKAYHLLKKEQFDLIYSHWFVPQGLISYILSKIFKIDYKITIHSTGVSLLSKYGKIGNLFSKNILRNSAGVSVTSKNVLETVNSVLSKKEMSNLNISIFPMGIFSEKFEITPTESKFKKFKGYKNILFLGRLSEKKGINKLINAFNTFSSDKKVNLIIAGDGPLINELEKLINYYNLQDCVFLIGKVSDIEKIELINICEILVVPSIRSENDFEGMPVVIIEGLYFSKIVVASEETNCQEVINHKENGFIYSSNEQLGLLNCLNEVEELNEDEINRVKLSAKATSRNFDTFGSFNNYKNFLNIN